MKKLSEKFLTFILLVCIGTSLLSVDAFATTENSMKTTVPTKIVQVTKNPLSSQQTADTYSDIIGWRYKSVDNKVYRRQYNYSKQKWIGAWELC